MFTVCTLFLRSGPSLGMGRSFGLTLLGDGNGTMGSKRTSTFSDIISFFRRSMGFGTLPTGCKGTMPSITASSVILSGTLGAL